MSNRSLFIKIYKLIDILTVIICFWVTNSIDTGTRLSFSSLMAINVKLGHLGLIVFFLMAWHVVFSVVGLYRSKRLGSRYYELIDILKCTSVGSVIMMVSGFLFGIEILSATFISIFWGITSFFLITGRLVIRRVLAVFRKQGINQRNLVIVGTGQRAVDFAGFARNKREL
ncbi:hypothetical protein H8E50_12525, partial [bacterium]|nr:hypothetical protein [bacterium]